MDKRIIIYGNHSEWLDYCFSSAETDSYILFNQTFPTKSHIINALSKFVFYGLKFNFLKRFLFWFFTKSLSNKKKETNDKILIIYDWHILANDELFLVYLKKKFPNVKLVYLFTNIVKLSGAQKNSFVSELPLYYDLIYAFDLGDSVKYDFLYSQLIYNCSKHASKDSNNNLIDCFYVGNAKDRLDMLHKVYSVLESFDLKLEFNICGVPKEKQTHKTGIHYNHYLHYVDIVEKIKNSKCIIDVIQGESQGLTIKVCEAVIFDKLLITTNKSIVNEPFYRKDYILIIDDNCIIDESFFNNYSNVNYSFEDKQYFSLLRFEKQLLNNLEKKGII